MPTLEDIRVWLQEPEPRLQPGNRLGDYIVLELIGRGAYADVWRAEHSLSNSSVAIKVFRRDGFPESERATAALRFLEGVTAMQRLRACQGVVHLHSEAILGEHLWFAMDYLPESDLPRYQKAHAVSDAEAITIIDELLLTLQQAHALGVVHRDIRPPNILIHSGNGTIRPHLADFDLAYFDHLLRERDTTAVAIGVARYLPPDLFTASPKDLKSLIRRPSNDVYSVCIVAFDLLAGDQASIPSDRSQRSFVQSIREQNPHRSRLVATRLARLCERGLASDPRRWFKTSQEARQYWKTECTEARFSKPIVFAVLIGLAIAFTVTADFLFFGHGIVSNRLAARALTLLPTSLVSLTVVPPIYRRIQSTINTSFSARPWLRWLGLATSLLLLSAALAVFHPLSRLSELVVTRAQPDSYIDQIDPSGRRLVRSRVVTGQIIAIYPQTDRLALSRGSGVRLQPRSILGIVPETIETHERMVASQANSPSDEADRSVSHGGNPKPGAAIVEPAVPYSKVSQPDVDLAAPLEELGNLCDLSGVLRACVEVAIRLEQAQTPLRAFPYRLRSCNLGDGYSCYVVAQAYARRTPGIEVNADTAESYYEKACESDWLQACGRVGSKLLAVYKSEREAGNPEAEATGLRSLKFLQIGCDASVALTCADLAFVRYHGVIGPRNREEGIRLWERSCRRGHQRSCKLLTAIEGPDHRAQQEDGE